jgi:hypothetical protein
LRVVLWGKGASERLMGRDKQARERRDWKGVMEYGMGWDGTWKHGIELCAVLLYLFGVTYLPYVADLTGVVEHTSVCVCARRWDDGSARVSWRQW